MILSFGFTWPAFVARAKSCTRRSWKLRTVAIFGKGTIRPLPPGVQTPVHEAWDTGPRCGGQKIGTLALTQFPLLQPLAEMLDSDFYAEGFEWFAEHPKGVLPRAWKQPWAPGETCARIVPADRTPAGRQARADWIMAFKRWRSSGASLYAVRFEIVSVEPEAERRLERLLKGETG